MNLSGFPCEKGFEYVLLNIMGCTEWKSRFLICKLKRNLCDSFKWKIHLWFTEYNTDTIDRSLYFNFYVVFSWKTIFNWKKERPFFIIIHRISKRFFFSNSKYHIPYISSQTRHFKLCLKFSVLHKKSRSSLHSTGK